MAKCDSINAIPDWALACLGECVRLTARHDEYGDGAFVYEPGRVFRLDAIQARSVALVEVLEKPGGLLEVPFSALEPA